MTESDFSLKNKEWIICPLEIINKNNINEYIEIAPRGPIHRIDSKKRRIPDSELKEYFDLWNQ